MIHIIKRREILELLSPYIEEFIERATPGYTGEELYHYLLDRLADPSYQVAVSINDMSEIDGFCTYGIAYFPRRPYLSVETVFVKTKTARLELYGEMNRFVKANNISQLEIKTYWGDLSKYEKVILNAVEFMAENVDSPNAVKYGRCYRLSWG